MTLTLQMHLMRISANFNISSVLQNLILSSHFYCCIVKRSAWTIIPNTRSHPDQSPTHSGSSEHSQLFSDSRLFVQCWRWSCPNASEIRKIFLKQIGKGLRLECRHQIILMTIFEIKKVLLINIKKINAILTKHNIVLLYLVNEDSRSSQFLR